MHSENKNGCHLPRPLAKARLHPTGRLHQGTNGNLPRNRAYLLTHLRTGHNWLSTDHKTNGYSDNDKKCLTRDRHRCVVSRKFDRVAARKRFAENAETCTDDDGKLLRDEASDQFQCLEVAHIIHH